jgi:hypothetical protein
MGAGNVKAVYALWADLPDRPFRVLAYMALTAKDADDPPKFWGGRESLAVAIGRKVSPNDSEASVRTTFRAVRSAVKQLIEADAIKLDRHHAPGVPARYALQLRPNRGDLLTPEQGGLAAPNRGDLTSQQGGLAAPTGVTYSPLEDYKDHEDLSEDESHLRSAPLGSEPVDYESPHSFVDGGRYPGECVCTFPRRHLLHASSAVRAHARSAS